VNYDLKAAYNHNKIHLLQAKYLGAAIMNPEGTTTYFTFIFLPLDYHQQLNHETVQTN
jgi:hypothetical protein